jgi:release factor glutamine methyltransferase
LTEGKALLEDFPAAAIETKVLALKSLAIPEEVLYAHPGKTVSKSKMLQFYKLVSKRRRGIPLAYVVGEREFWGLPFIVRPGVLIPRPETEILVGKVIELSSKSGETILDIGTGCGNVAVSLAKELPEVRIWATDISSKAVKTARENTKMHKVPNIDFLEGDLFSPLKKNKLESSFDFIVSNPPYISENHWVSLHDEIRLHEPKKALVSGKTGLEFIENLVSEALNYLKGNGYLCMEIGFGQEGDVLSLFGDRWGEIGCFKDLNEIPRIVVARKSS